jgi:hypothetical protein
MADWTLRHFLDGHYGRSTMEFVAEHHISPKLIFQNNKLCGAAVMHVLGSVQRGGFLQRRNVRRGFSSSLGEKHFNI